MPPPGYEPFLRAICADPEDDTVRLVFADWLDENGDPERAEFIRLQVAVPERPQEYDPQYARADALRKKNWTGWFGELPKLSGIGWVQSFRRGFVSGAIAHTGKWLCVQHERVFGATPVQSLTLNVGGLGPLERALLLSELGRLSELCLRGCRLVTGQWEVLTGCPHLARLQWLCLDWLPVPPAVRSAMFLERDAEAFVNSTCLPRLKLIVICDSVNPAALALLRTRFEVRAW
jgi:uncharacterized protein (TIGR02996 family)